MSEKILDKIKKCLALASSANEHEAAAALRQAQKLMAQFGLTETDVTLADVGEVRQQAQNVPVVRYCSEASQATRLWPVTWRPRLMQYDITRRTAWSGRPAMNRLQHGCLR